jgi:hypothetical protein
MGDTTPDGRYPSWGALSYGQLVDVNRDGRAHAWHDLLACITAQ